MEETWLELDVDLEIGRVYGYNYKSSSSGKTNQKEKAGSEEKAVTKAGKNEKDVWIPEGVLTKPEGTRVHKDPKPGDSYRVSSGGSNKSDPKEKVGMDGVPKKGDQKGPNGYFQVGNGDKEPKIPQVGTQTPYNPDDYHCDIQVWNKCLEEGLDPRGPGGQSWDGNALKVSDIYRNHYQSHSQDTPRAGTRGIGFYNSQGDSNNPHHMFYYEYDGGSTYRVFNPTTGSQYTEHTWSTSGQMVLNSTFVSLNDL